MANILCLETATTNCSVAVSVAGELAALVEENSKNYSHSEQLHVFIDQALAEAGVAMANLDAIAVSKGPGSYTGLRIGVSAAKGLCFALDKPLIAIPTLQSMAKQLQVAEGELIVSLLDARRMEVYANAYDHQYQTLGPTKAEIITEDSFADYRTYKQVYLIGSGAAKCQEPLKGAPFQFKPEVIPSAREMVALADAKFNAAQLEDVAYFEPYYLKDFVLQTKKKA